MPARALEAAAFNPSEASSLVAMTVTSCPIERAASRMRKGKRPLPAIRPRCMSKGFARYSSATSSARRVGRRKVRLANGKEMSALEIQSEYHSRAAEFVDREGFGPVHRQMLELWGQIGRAHV